METTKIKQGEIVVIDDDIDVGGGGLGVCRGGIGEYLAEKEKEVMEALKMKAEPVTMSDHEECLGLGGGGGGCPLSSQISMPTPMEGLRESGLAPFLRKIFGIVDNPETDSIISWSLDRRSFIVWDAQKFSADLLPKHFRHNNFSSFIRQLNTYGFRKIDSDRWEFANEGFQGGKRHLLKSIKRRNRPSHIMHQQVAAMSPWIDLAKLGFQVEIEKLRNRFQAELEKLRSEHNTLKVELLKLKQQQEKTQNNLDGVKQRLQSTELKQHKLVIFVAKTFNPTFLHQFIMQLKPNRELGSSENSKKQRLVAPSSIESPVLAADTTDLCISCCSQNQEESATVQSDIQTLFAASVDDDRSGSPDQDKRASNAVSGTSTPDLNSEDFALWEKILGEDLACENHAEEELAQYHSKIVLELEDLIAKPGDWGGHVNELVEQAACFQPKS